MKATAPANPASQLAAMIGKFSPRMAAKIKSVRAALRKRLPAANELVYDNYNFFVIGYATTERPSDTTVALVADAHGVRLAFYYGSSLPDPEGVLEGSGSQNRFIRLTAARDLERPPVAALIDAALAHSRRPMPAKGKGELVIRSISPKQRPRRLAGE